MLDVLIFTYVADGSRTPMSPGKTGGFDDSGTRDVAREARRAQEVKRRQAMVKKVLVSRVPAPGKGFRWEIRRFGTFVLAAGDVGFETASAAKAAGDTILAAWAD